MITTEQCGEIGKIVLIAAAASIATNLVISCSQRDYKQEAIDAGVAIHTINPQPGETSFEWIEPGAEGEQDNENASTKDRSHTFSRTVEKA